MTTSWTYFVTPPPASEAIGDSFSLEIQLNHVENATGNLLEQFKSLPRMEAFVSAVVSLLQPLESLFWQMLRERYLNEIDGEGPAEGVQLDGLGRIVGEPRKFRSDIIYRIFLSVRVLINTSNGKVNELNAILSLLYMETIRVLEVYPAHLEIYTTANQFVIDSFFAMKDSKAAGIGLSFIYSEADAIDVFTFSDVYDTEQASGTQGWGSEYVVTGGEMAGVFSWQ